MWVDKDVESNKEYNDDGHSMRYWGLGMDTSAVSCGVTALENKLNGMLDSMFS